MTDKEIIDLIKQRKKGVSKYTTLGIVIILLAIGILGSVRNSFIDMDNFIKFLNAFNGVIMALIGSVGIGLAVKNFRKGDKDE